MSLGNIKHRFAVQVHANNEESRLIGILKVAELFEHAGVHLSVDLSPGTTALVDQAMSHPHPNPVGNGELLAVVVETLSPMTPGRMGGSGMPAGGSPYFQTPSYPQDGWRPNQAAGFGTDMTQQRSAYMNPRQFGDPMPYNAAALVVTHFEKITGLSVDDVPAFEGSIPLDPTPHVLAYQDEIRRSALDTMVSADVTGNYRWWRLRPDSKVLVAVRGCPKFIWLDLLSMQARITDLDLPSEFSVKMFPTSPLQRADASPPLATESTPIFNQDAYGAVTEAGQAAMRAMEETVRGNIPGYEHNPMARAEHIPQPQSPAVVAKIEGSPVFGNWPDPAPALLTLVTHIARLDDYGDGEPGFDYQIYSRGRGEGWKKLRAVSIMSHCDVEEGPNYPRIEDYLAICADHLSSCIRADKTFGTNHTNRTHGEALNSIRRALSVLNGNTAQQHLGTQAPKDAAPDAESAAS